MTATWWRVTVTGEPDQGDAIAATLIAATGQGVEERQSGTLCTTVASHAEADAIVQRVQREHRGVEASIAAEDVVDWSTRSSSHEVRRGKTVPDTGRSSMRGLNQIVTALIAGRKTYVRKGCRAARSRASAANAASSSGVRVKSLL